MPKVAPPLTANRIELLRPGEEARDSQIPGLSVWRSKRVTGWNLTYTSPVSGKRKRMLVGYWPDMSLTRARRRAEKLRNQVVEGIDPSLPETPQETVRSAFERYQEEKLDRLRTGRQIAGALARLIDAHGEIPLNALTRREILEIHGSLLSSGWSVAANRFLIRASTFLRWAHDAGLVEQNAAAGLIRSRRVPEQSRERVLTDAEIKAIWRRTNDGSPFARLVRLLLLSGQRRNEIARMRSDWVGKDGWITVPASEYKTNKGHRWFATELARMNLPDPLPDGRLFPSMSYDRHKKPLDEACGVTGWTLHDLRRTLATRMMAAGERSEVVEAVLGHKIGGGGIREVYRRYDFAEERKAAMVRWSAEVERIVR